MTQHIYILSGDKQSGKSTALKDFSSNKQDINGFITLDEKVGIRSIFDLESGLSTPYATKLFDPYAIPIGRWYIYKEGLEVGKKILRNYDFSNQKFLIIDEIGSLELEGKGYHDELLGLLSRIVSYKEHIKILLVVRTELLDKVIAYFGISEANVIGKEELKEIKLFN